MQYMFYFRVNNKSISLQLDHINGIRTDNRLENLRLLCPNCHSQTETFCGKNNRKKKEKKKMNT
jgi:5-methylcytosine-specific restriction endonuclease McrA